MMTNSLFRTIIAWDVVAKPSNFQIFLKRFYQLSACYKLFPGHYRTALNCMCQHMGKLIETTTVKLLEVREYIQRLCTRLTPAPINNRSRLLSCHSAILVLSVPWLLLQWMNVVVDGPAITSHLLVSNKYSRLLFSNEYEWNRGFVDYNSNNASPGLSSIHRTATVMAWEAVWIKTKSRLKSNCT